jgi:hypothetical protein
MNTSEELAAEVHAYCVVHQDPKNAQKWARYFKEGYDAWGLLDKENPLWNEKQREWMERYRGLGLDGFAKAGEILLASGKYEEASMAIRFLKELRDQFDGRMAARLAGYFRAGIPARCWSSCARSCWTRNGSSTRVSAGFCARLGNRPPSPSRRSSRSGRTSRRD